MARYSNIKKLNKQSQEDLFIRFARSLASIKNSEEAASFMRDLFTEQEILILSRRLEIAELLLEGLSYQNIRKLIPVSDSTIAKVQLWLTLHGEGFRVILQRTKKIEGSSQKTGDAFSWASIKKRYPQYFWPQAVLQEIVRMANKKERERLQKVITDMDEKSKLSKDLMKLLKR